MLKISIFQWLNNVVAAMYIALVPGNEFNEFAGARLGLWFSAPWYPSGAALIMNALFGDLFFINFIIDGLRPPELFLKWILAPRAKTQGRMNELFSIPADITLAMRMQLLNKFLLLGLMFSFAMPMLFLFLSVYCWSAGWVDRYNFLRQLRPPPATHGQSMVYVYLYILPFAILMQVWMAVKSFIDICDEDGYVLGAEAAALAAGNASGVDAGGGGGGGGGGGAASDECSRTFESFMTPAPPGALASGCYQLGGLDERDEEAYAIGVAERIQAVFNGTGAVPGGADVPTGPEALLSCVTTAAGPDGAVASACRMLARQTITTSAFCGNDSWSSARVILWSCASVSTVLLFYYVLTTITRMAEVDAARTEAISSTGNLAGYGGQWRRNSEGIPVMQPKPQPAGGKSACAAACAAGRSTRSRGRRGRRPSTPWAPSSPTRRRRRCARSGAASSRLAPRCASPARRRRRRSATRRSTRSAAASSSCSASSSTSSPAR